MEGWGDATFAVFFALCYNLFKKKLKSKVEVEVDDGDTDFWIDFLENKRLSFKHLNILKLLDGGGGAL